MHMFWMTGLIFSFADLFGQRTQAVLKHAIPLAQYVINNAGIAEWDKLENVTAEGLIRHGPTGVLRDADTSPELHMRIMS